MDSLLSWVMLSQHCVHYVYFLYGSWVAESSYLEALMLSLSASPDFAH